MIDPERAPAAPSSAPAARTGRDPMRLLTRIFSGLLGLALAFALSLVLLVGVALAVARSLIHI